ncbi:discoidin domain-containing protein [Paenibacillus sp. J5C_2022]|uniref:discoidin domain-containing protein n=1 Tax=Paenibacillus sp. J5C2022 TaxID=2977129 RepID=UPI0021D0B934|nr:discoidin domain-containing protein [Paenibacillus sp. J5C2022]MCU6710084.1 discoidin domain-containing protein [Paenibacillus sp. J5C2022]
MALTLNNSLLSLKVGDYVWCKYTASSGAVGVFSDLGSKTDSDVAGLEIPVASSATPDGYFRYICVDFDYCDRAMLIADRNIQHSISWDTLNTSGIASGSGLPVSFESYSEGFNFTIRLLTGGVSSSDTDNEWDKYIVSSTLSETIVAGDNNVWNWNQINRTWTSTTGTTSSSNRVCRGNNAGGIHYYGNIATSGATNVGFRPVLLIENLAVNKSFILINSEYKKWDEGNEYIPPIAGDNLIPIMTSDTTPSGIASVSSTFSSSYLAWRLFDKDNSSHWLSNSTLNQWMKYEFPSAVTAHSYKLTSSATTGSPNDMIREWVLEGSNDDSVWGELDTRNNQTNWGLPETREYSIGTPLLYKYYRIRIITNNGTSTYHRVSGWELIGTETPATPETPPSWQTISTTLPSAETFKNEGMEDLSIMDRKETSIVQTMIDNGALGAGKVFSSTVDLKKYFDIRNMNIK